MFNLPPYGIASAIQSSNLVVLVMLIALVAAVHCNEQPQNKHK